MSLNRSIDRVCRDFEAAWRAGQRPRIEDEVAGLAPASRAELLRALLVLEVALRRQAGEQVTVAEYERRFPESLAPVEQAFAASGSLLNETRGQSSATGGEPSAEAADWHLTVRCPHCHSPHSVADVELCQAITCSSCGNSFSLIEGQSTATHSSHARRRLGQFELVEQLGVGTFGSVWKARDTQLDRVVAIKIPRKEQLAPHEIEQFFREARAAAQLRHPNIVSVHEVGRDGSTVYIVSDLIHGVTLSDWLTGQRATPREAAEMCALVADALHHAHERGVVHRDLKPGNIMLDVDACPHLMDFGLAKREAGEVTMTVEGRVLGTPAYMSPELARGEGHAVDRRSDVYSLGVVLFQLLTGELPFRGTPRMLLHQVLNDEPRAPRSLNDSVPVDLDTICLKAMAKDPARRYATAADLADDLRRWLRGEPILARPLSRRERAWRWTRRNPRVAALWAGLLMALSIGLAGVTWQWRLAEAERRAADAQRQLATQAQSDAQKQAESERVARLDADHAKQDAEAALAAAEWERQTAQQERQRAEANFQRARAAVDDYFTRVSESRLLDEPGLQPLRRELLEQAMRYYEEFRKEHADEPQVRAELAAAQLRLAQIQLVMGQTDAALDSLAQSLAMIEKLLDEGTDPAQFPSWFAGSFRAPRYNRNDSAVPSNPFRALALLKKACTVWERLTAAAPGAAGFRQDLAGCYYHYGEAMFVLGQTDVAIEHMLKACGLLESLAVEHPEVATYRDEFALVAADTGYVLELAGRLADAREFFEHALAIHPRSPVLWNRMAHRLAESGGGDGRDAARAVELARQAVEASPRSAQYRNTLGVALYRTRDWVGAIKALQESVDMRDGGDAFDFFYLAMAEQRLGRADAARDWFAKGAAWVEKQNPRTARRIRPLFAEAAGVVGLSGPAER